MWQLFSPVKEFNNYWVGHKTLNQFGLHKHRMLFAERCAELRRHRALSKTLDNEVTHSLFRNGYAMVENFIPHNDHRDLVNEIEAHIARINQMTPAKIGRINGFGSKQFFDGGFDRYDGSTLNRFISVDPDSMPNLHNFTKNAQLDTLTRAVTGRGHSAQKTNLYVMMHGDEDLAPDLQKDLHRDTFFSAMKFWYFPYEVTLEDGPFYYVPGSHQLTDDRLQWELETAQEAIATQSQPNIGGSFRIHESELSQLGLPAPVPLICKPNTLVIANVLGFHRRGSAQKNRTRVSIYGWNRPYPFSPI